MERPLDGSCQAMGPEIDNVIEHEAGLRSLADACRLLRVDASELMSLIARGALPNAYETEGRWRIPVADIRARMSATGSEEPETAGVLVRRRWPFDKARHRPPAWMIPAERRAFIVEQLRTRGPVRVTELSAKLGVSQMTVGRDLARLESEGALIRRHGGAIPARRAPGASLQAGPRADQDGG